jgi:dTMP kinase
MALGRFIVVEGLEGAGKTTAIDTLRSYLKSQAKQVIMTREPGGTQLGEQLRALLKHGVEGEVVEPRAELLMMYAARVQLVEQVIQPALLRGDWVISDRFEMSTYAYQGGGRGFDKVTIDSLSAICLQGFKPDLIIYMDISPEKGLERVTGRGEFDRIEQESLDFFQRVHKAYLDMVGTMNNVSKVDASQSMELVQESVLKQLITFLNSNELR